MQNINFVGKKLIKFFRYGTVTGGVLLGFVVSFFVFGYYDTAKRIDVNESDDRKKYSYESSVTYVAYGKQLDINDINYSEFTECDIVIADTLFYVGDSEYPRTSDVVLYGDELVYPVVEGGYPDNQTLESDEPSVVLGKYLKRFTYRRNGKDYIKINGDEYYVTGYVSAENSNVFDYKVILYYECIGEGALKDVEYYKNNAGIFITFNSYSDVVKYNTLFDYYEKIYPENWYETDYESFEFGDSISDDSRKNAVLIYAFTLIIITLVIVYWYLSNKKEFAIRRTYGYSKIRIIAMMVKRLMTLLFVAMFVSELIIFLMNRLEGPFEILGVGDYFDQLRVMLKYVVITIPIIMIFPIVQICFDSPDALLKECD